MLFENCSAVGALPAPKAEAIASVQRAVSSGSNRSAASIATPFFSVPAAMLELPAALPCREMSTHETRTCSAWVTARPSWQASQASVSSSSVTSETDPRPALRMFPNAGPTQLNVLAGRDVPAAGRQAAASRRTA